MSLFSFSIPFPWGRKGKREQFSAVQPRAQGKTVTVKHHKSSSSSINEFPPALSPYESLLLVFSCRHNGSSIPMTFQFFRLSIRLKAYMMLVANLGPCRTCSLVQNPIRWLECRDVWKNLVLLVIREAAGRKMVHSKTAVSGRLLSREPFMPWPCMKYGKMVTVPKDGDKDSVAAVHCGLWGNYAEESVLVSIGNTCQNRLVQKHFGEEQQFFYSKGLFFFFSVMVPE